ncbi:MAG: redoxin domain-containing protein [Planctomycetota bacterium]
MIRALLVLLAASLSADQVSAQDAPTAPTLKAGDAAPALAVKEWIKGDAVDGFKKDKVYVIEFWATWCGPCIGAMPHLSDIQRRYADKGLRVIGMTSEGPSNDLAKVKAMVKAKGDIMGYTVAWDDGRKTNTAFMKAAQQRGIPCSFVIANQKVAYIGHPMWIDIPIEKIYQGTWDPKTGPETLRKAQQELSQALRLARSDAKAALTQLDAFSSKYASVAERFAVTRFELLLRSGEWKRASEFGKQLVTKATKQNDAQQLNRIAWTIVDPASPWKERDLDLARRAAAQANKLSEKKNAAILDTAARVSFLRGRVHRALRIQKQAVKLASDRMKPSLEKTLQEYQAAARSVVVCVTVLRYHDVRCAHRKEFVPLL